MNIHQLKAKYKDFEIEELAKSKGIETDTNIRWENGIEHHSKSIDTYELLETADWVFGGDYFCWKVGGDGDNGECLLFSLDVMFELLDKLNEVEK